DNLTELHVKFRSLGGKLPLQDPTLIVQLFENRSPVLFNRRTHDSLLLRPTRVHGVGEAKILQSLGALRPMNNSVRPTCSLIAVVLKKRTIPSRILLTFTF